MFSLGESLFLFNLKSAFYRKQSYQSVIKIEESESSLLIEDKKYG